MTRPPQDANAVRMDGELGKGLEVSLRLELHPGLDRDHPCHGRDHRNENRAVPVENPDEERTDHVSTALPLSANNPRGRF